MDKETLKKLHDTELEILDVIVKICKDNNITYYLAGGSVLGAIRHKGIIPWDDDIDIMMYRSDLDKFERICKDHLPEGYFYQSSKTDPHYHHIFSKVRKNDTLFIEKQTATTGQHNGIFVDIFPIDSAKREYGIQTKQAMFANKIEKILKVKDNIMEGNIIDKVIAKIFSEKSLLTIQRKILSAFNNPKNEYYVNFGSQYGVKKQTMKRSVYYPPIEVEFEKKKYCIPNDYQFFLKKLYGDKFMELPPENKRITHNPVKIAFSSEEGDIK